MQTNIATEFQSDPDVQISEQQLRTCVHCGFCNATCPTYLITGNELEGPRGRIYLIKNLLEGKIEPSAKTLAHIDNCLGCLACETTCPSGVSYSHLLEDVRPRLENLEIRDFWDQVLRTVLTHLLPYPGRFRLALRFAWLGRLTSFMLPARFRPLLAMAPDSLPPPATLANPGTIPAAAPDGSPRRMRVALLTGCAQQVIGPSIYDAAVRLLTRLGAEIVIPSSATCCGALTYHMGERARSLELMRRMVEAWYAEIEHHGLDAIVLTTSGCGAAVREYGHIFRNDPELAQKAAAVTELVRDVSEVVDQLGLEPLQEVEPLTVAYHDACSLQHGQKVKEEPRRLLRQAGFNLVEVPEAHICCGSAGTYNMLRPELAKQLQERKCANVSLTGADVVAAGNIGCLEQIGGGCALPVLHTVELLDWATGGPKPQSLVGSTYKTSST